MGTVYSWTRADFENDISYLHLLEMVLFPEDGLGEMQDWRVFRRYESAT